MILVVNGSSYECSKKVVDVCITTAKESFREKGKIAIVALERSRIVQMVAEEFDSEEEMKRQAFIYRENGFKVHSISKN